MSKHPFSKVKIDKIIADIESAYGIEVAVTKIVTGPDALVITNEVIYYDENVKSIKAFIEKYPKTNPVRDEDEIKRCCWDKSLFIVRSKNAFEGYDGSTNMNKSYNYVPFADDHEESSTTEDTGKGGGEIVKGEGTGIKVGRKNFPSDASCEELKVCGDCISTQRIQIGVVDFGWGDYHADTIRSIIKKEYGAAQLHDYNLIASFGIASVMAICCQIARAINERMDILNMSIGYYSMIENPLLEKYIEKAAQAGVLIVCSSGNSDNNNSTFKHWPSNFSMTYNNVITVSSVSSHNDDNDFKKAPYSNYEGTDSSSLNVFAKGEFPYPDHIKLYGDEGLIRNANGTSFSTAYVVGKIARLFKNNGKVTYLSADGFDRIKILKDLNSVAKNIDIISGTQISSRPV